MVSAAHAKGAAEIAARGISVTKEIAYATVLGLAGGSVFKVRALRSPAPLARHAAAAPSPRVLSRRAPACGRCHASRAALAVRGARAPAAVCAAQA